VYIGNKSFLLLLRLSLFGGLLGLGGDWGSLFNDLDGGEQSLPAVRFYCFD